MIRKSSNFDNFFDFRIFLKFRFFCEQIIRIFRKIWKFRNFHFLHLYLLKKWFFWGRCQDAEKNTKKLLYPRYSWLFVDFWRSAKSWPNHQDFSSNLNVGFRKYLDRIFPGVAVKFSDFCSRTTRNLISWAQNRMLCWSEPIANVSISTKFPKIRIFQKCSKFKGFY